MATLKKAGLITLILSLILKFAGFVREAVLADKFGASALTDGYLIAFSLITLIVVMTSEGFNSVFLPLFTRSKQENENESYKTASALLNNGIVILVSCSILIYFAIPIFLPLFFSDVNAQTLETSIEVMQFFVVFLALISVNGMFESYLQSFRSFIPTQISRLLATLMSAVFGLLFAEELGIYSLAYGFVFGVLVGTIIQIISLKRYGYKYYFTFKSDKVFLRSFVVLFFPAILSSIVGQINVLVDKVFASGTIEGAVTYLNNSSLIVSIPQGIYATTIVAILFTLLSEQGNDQKKFQETLHRGIKITIITLMPMTLGVIILGNALISVIYQRGLFNAVDTAMTYHALLVYSPLILVQGIQYIILKAMYVQRKTKKIFSLSVYTIILNIAFNYIFIKFFGYLGTALSTSMLAFFFLIATSIALYKDLDKGQWRRSLFVIIKVLPASIIMGIAVIVVKEFVFYGFPPILILIIASIIGVIVFSVTLLVTYRDGFMEIINLLPKKVVSKFIS
ncbi:MAG: murein biosynthesis integral membrane protein MurJ [Bacillaceae bacterium]